MSLPICMCETCRTWSDKCECDLRYRRWNLDKPKPSKRVKKCQEK